MKACLLTLSLFAGLHPFIANATPPQTLNDPFLPSAPVGSALYKKLGYPAPELYPFYRNVGLLQGICSVSFIQTSQDADAPAYLLSAGHCVQALETPADNEVILDKDVTLRAEFNNFVDSQDNRIPVNIERIAYSTMKGMDISVLKTDKTINGLKALSLSPFTLSQEVPAANEKIIVAGMPNAQPLMIDQCDVAGRVDLLEGMWHFNDFLENNCVLIGGMSGGPSFKIDAGGKPTELVAVSSTAADGRPWLGTPCYLNHPCVGRPQGFVQASNSSYVVPIAGLHECFDDQGFFQLSRAGCPLPTPTGVSIANHPVDITGTNAAIENQTWNFTPQHASGALKVKKIKIEGPSTTCKSMVGYESVSLPSFDPGNEKIPVHEEAIYQYCVLPASSDAGNNADVIMIKVDNTPPAAQPDVRVIKMSEDTVRIFYSFVLDENAGFYSVYGPLDTFVCPGVGSESYKKVAELTAIDLSYTRVKVCTYLEDPAINRGAIFELDYPSVGAK